MDPLETVNAFIHALEANRLEDALALCTEDIEYDNVPMQAVHGKDQVRATLGPFLGGASAINWVIHARRPPATSS